MVQLDHILGNVALPLAWGHTAYVDRQLRVRHSTIRFGIKNNVHEMHGGL